VFFLRKPSAAQVEGLLLAHRQDSYSYTEIGATQSGAPADYNLDHNRVLLGRGPDAFARAVAAVNEWKMFDMDWVELLPVQPKVNAGETIAVIVRHLGFRSVNLSRVVYLIEEDERFGFAYGTPPCHAEQGEERFMVEHDTKTDEVWYDLFACSKPRDLFARLGYPISRHLQKRFARDSLAAMQRAVLQF
jgi:uncharacterized protein (UPF0548 family)